VSGKKHRRRRETNLSALFTWRSAISSPESGLTPTEHHVGLTLSLHMNELGGSCFPSIDPTLHEETCGRSAATIRTALNQLVALGWLDRTIRVGRENSNEYAARVPSWYQTHRAQADLELDVARRRELALAAASEALRVPDEPSTNVPAGHETRLSEAGLREPGAAGESAALDRETRRSQSVNPPGTGAEDVRRTTSEGDNSSRPSSPRADQAYLQVEDPAAAEAPARDAEISELVLALPGADIDSPKRIVPLAHGLPRSVFLAAIATVEERGRAGAASNPCGLLTHLLRIARAERAAIFSAQLAVELGANAPSYTPSPWLAESLKRDDPARYVRLVATVMNDADLAVALGDRPMLDALLELAANVRAGDEPAERIGTPTEERRRWVEQHAAADPDADKIVDSWHDVDDVERQELHELAARIRETTAAGEAEAA
jgi:hypothetical protein